MAIREKDRSMLNRRDLLKGIGGAVAAAATVSIPRVRTAKAAARFEGETLRVQIYAGVEGQNIRVNGIEPFSKATGSRFVISEGTTSRSVAKLRAEKGNPSTTLYTLDGVGVIQAAREGVLEPYNLAALPNAKDIGSKFFVEGTGIGIFIIYETIIYNTELVKPAPTSWADLWDPRFKDKLAVPKAGGTAAHTLSIFAAIAHGGSQYKMEPAWEALRRLRPNVHVQETNAAVLAEFLRTGEIHAAIWVFNSFKPYVEKGYPIAGAMKLKEGLKASPGCAAIAKNHPDKREVADAFINYLVSVEAQTAMANTSWISPANKRVKVAPEIAKYIHSAEEGISLDQDHYAAHQEEWAKNYIIALQG